MNARFIVFLSVLAGILSLSSFYVGTRLIAGSSWAARHGEVVWLALALFVALQFLGPFLYRSYPNRRNRLLVVHWVTYTTLGVFGCLLLYSMAADLLAALWRLSGLRGGSDAFGFPAVAVMVLITVVVGFWQAVSGPRVYEVDVALEGLPEAFAGFRIVQISDLHLGPTLGRRFTQRVVKLADALSPDVVALSGDLVDGSVHVLAPAVAPLAGLAPAQATFFVPGNHEYYWGVHLWLAKFRALGAKVLLNEHAVLRRRGSELVIAGVGDYSAARRAPGSASDPARARAGAPPGAVKVLLAHHPHSHREAAEAGFDLQLSGHTHGGQFFPFSLLVRLTHRYCKGLHRSGRLWVYVSRGTGYWGPPLRFLVPAEITLVRLQPAAPREPARP